jgi:hypothetical protein
VIKEMENAAIDQKNGFKLFFISRSVSDQIQAVTSKLDYACNSLQVSCSFTRKSWVLSIVYVYVYIAGAIGTDPKLLS